MPQTPYEPESSTSSVKNRVREDAVMPDLPEFDSLPASAGLNNTETNAFGVTITTLTDANLGTLTLYGFERLQHWYSLEPPLRVIWRC